MTEKEQEIFAQYVGEVKELYGNDLQYVILYGSRARGDHREDSDYDIMCLVNLSEAEIRELRGKQFDIDYAYDEQYDIYVSSIVRNVSFFNRWVRAHPFYNSVWNEGVALYDREKNVG